MIELRFHEELYDGFAIDEAVKLYEPYASFTLERERGGFTVKLEAKADAGVEEALIAAELANYALGKTIERSRETPATAGAPAKEAA